VNVLLDWDNLESLSIRKGPRYVADRLWASLKNTAPTATGQITAIHLRFYGGWNDGTSITRLGQELIAGVAAEFPFIQREPDARNVTVPAEVAQSLLRVPRHPPPYISPAWRSTEAELQKSSQRRMLCGQLFDASC
jgi:hypothetical protein